ncbi:phenylalanine--tRNA ligase subunit beta [Rubritalea marina]|uniref:phenylalanine--tRNA ligase subunit beta n=1 Tax=Rubritalea marina TaxID=361055 RepID=UPI00036EF7CC|nr:phenylalanine--tRNA ligase subunit beta [Rubritalea marina]
MNVSFNWLNDHLDLSDHSIAQLDDLLTFAGVEVEGVEQQGLSTELVVVAQIKDAVQHPNADRLKVCQVDAGEGSLRQIVCGAQNYKVGDKVPCALPGADLGGGFVIKEGKLRDVESKGMLCGASEIGLVDAEDGLFILDEDAVIGTPLVKMFASDTIIEVEITPNRPDLLSHCGMARELAALTGKSRTEPAFDLLDATAASDITLSNPERCPLYTATKISGVKVADSPEWLQTKLNAIGLRPINNIVDITNYVLHELGHPLHAFDAAKLDGSLDIRTAAEGEKFLPLDGEEIALTKDDLLISDAGGQALALAGIMGGNDSGVTESTTDVVLEAAYFTPSFIRRSSRRTALSSDSSYRFERGSDPQAVLKAASLAAKLMVEVAGGTIDGPAAVAGEAPVLTQPVKLDIAKLDQLMGGSITHAAAKDILTKLGLEEGADDLWNIPSFRLDLQRHIDLVEEIARVHGLENVESRFVGAYVDESAVDHAYDYQLGLKRQLASLGFYETQTIKLIAAHSNDNMVAQMCDALPQRPLMDGDLVQVALPLSEDHAIMRPSLVPGLVAVAARNIRQGRKSLRFFEMGKQFRNAGGGKAKDLEAESLSLLVSGTNAPQNWASKVPSIADLFDLKAIVAAILPKAQVQLKERKRDGFILAADVLADGKPIGAFAQLTPARCREIDANNPVYVAELDLAKLQQLATGVEKVDELPQFPGSSRDAAMEAPLTLENAAIEAAIKKHNESLLVDFHCFDVFTDASGEKIAADKKSVAYSFHYRSPSKTLKAKEVDKAHQALLDTLANKLKLSFR